MAALSVTTEYRTGTMNTTRLAVPSRVRIFLSKAAVMAILGFTVGELTAFLSWGSSRLVTTRPQLLALDSMENCGTYSVLA
jgi:ABC-2 type transport system permease protein